MGDAVRVGVNPQVVVLVLDDAADIPGCQCLRIRGISKVVGELTIRPIHQVDSGVVREPESGFGILENVKNEAVSG